MEILKVVFLGIVQGLTEFLPVSSSGHLILAEEITGASVDSVFTSLILHLGTLVAVCIATWDSIKKLFKPPYKTLLFLIIATIPSAILGLLLEDFLDTVFSNGKILPFTFFMTAILLYLSSKIKPKQKPFTLSNSIFMGIGQTFALLPGLSRSGTTIACGILSGAKREEIAEFSFLMSIPIILGGSLVKIYKLCSSPVQITIDFAPLIAGFLSATLVGFIVIGKMFKIVKKGNFKPFCIYLTVLSLVCAVNYYLLPLW